MPKVSDLFEVHGGSNLALVDLEESPEGINFIGASGIDNGITGKVVVPPFAKVFEAGLISVACKGSVLSSFVQPEKFVTGKDMLILNPKTTMSNLEKWFYCYCLQFNSKYFSFGRQANRYVASIQLPDKIPDWVYDCKLDLPKTKVDSEIPELITANWKSFKLGDLFSITRGCIDRIPDELLNDGAVEVITSSDSNHGIAGYRDDLILLSKSNCLTIAADGSVGACFYHTGDIVANVAVNILISPVCSVYHYLFICSLVQKIRNRFSYGYKWSLERMKNTEIKLPATPTGEPDWEFMEQYMRSLPYSDLLGGTYD